MGRYDYLWSVGAEGTKDQQAAAIRLLYYLLSERAQDVLCVQNSMGVPLNKRMCQEYANVNSQDFSELPIIMGDIALD